MLEHRAFPLRPAPERGVRFQGTYREQGWRRCAEMSAADGITFTPWPTGCVTERMMSHPIRSEIRPPKMPVEIITDRPMVALSETATCS